MEAVVTNSKQNCFINTLSKLRESSRTAVVSADFTDEYTQYMHVDRPVQEEFLSIIKKTYNSDHAELILLCGSVGDGKSHMLSFCNEKYPEMMKNFYVHNDSTASLYIDKPASYTLMKIMEDFSDEKLESSTSKVILAINLGTLSNFFDADIDSKFSKLKAYVENAGILDEAACKDDENRYFHSVNFADYHLYELTPSGIQSSYIKGIFNKIVQKTENNIFFQQYCACCTECSSKDICPIKINYELLSDESIQNGIIDTLVESIVKNKLIVSTRSLLNMIYEILVDERYIDRGSLEPKKEPQKLTKIEYCEALLPNAFFGKRNASDILELMKTVDPLQIRNEEIDDFIVYYENTDEVIKIYTEELKSYARLLSKFSAVDFADPSNHGIKDVILKTYIRMCWLTGKRKDLLPSNIDYLEYMDALYAWNTGDAIKLKKTYGLVEKGVLAWNGNAEKNEMQLPFGNTKSPYHLIQEIKIKQRTDNLPAKCSGILNTFRDELKLKFSYGFHESAELEIDYALFTMLKKIINGYVPSINDKRVNVKCMEFINKISDGGSKKEQLIIRDLSKKEKVDYLIEYDDTFGYLFEVN